MFGVDPRVVEEVRRQQNPATYDQPEVEASPEPDPDIPSYQKKQFFENDTLDDLISRTLPKVRAGGGDETIAALRARRTVNQDGSYTAAIDDLLNRGLGSMTLNQIKAREKDVAFVEKYKLGKAYSYEDLALEALQSDPNFDPSDPSMVTTFAQDLEKRGLNNKKREDIKTLATQKSVANQIDKAVNPGKYLSEDKKTANTATADRLLKQTFGDDFSDPDLQQFLSDRLAEGESAFEVAQFLKTTPDFQKRQAEVENQRVQTESQAARQSLDAELLKSEEETFSRATPSIIASYMKAGRLDSSGLQNALSRARGDLARERQGFLANAGYQDSIRAQGYQRENFVGNQAQAFNQYLRQNEPAYQQRFALQGVSNNLNYQQPFNNLARTYALNDQNRMRQFEIEDYNRQQNDFYRYLNSQRGSGAQGALRGAMTGAQAGSAGGPWAALAGGVVGAGAGYYAYQ